MLIAGPVGASSGVPTAVTARQVSVPHASAVGLRGAGSNAGACAVVLLPLPDVQTAGQQDVPDGPGSCLAPARPSPPGNGAAVVGSDDQAAVTQSIGVSVRAG